LKNLLLITFLFFNFKAISNEIVVVGNIPDRYLKTNSNSNSNSRSRSMIGYIHIKDRVIVDIKETSIFRVKKKFPNTKMIIAKTGNKYDFLYPGLIDLHNHTKQNNLGVWTNAVGQFKNRFEWRAWSIYNNSVSGNMNPWIGYGKPIVCAAFRWSEMQAMVLGTTYLQGPSSCIKGFGIHQVEDTSSYISNKDKIQAPTDLVIPADMTFVWHELAPIIKSGKSYAQALAQKVNEHCNIDGVNAESILTKEIIKIFKDKNKLIASCTKGKLHPKFIRYVYWIHGPIAGKLKYIQKGNGALIAHLAEGRRDDYYNQQEFAVAKMLGFIAPHINYVHGVGVKKEHMKIMGENGMGLIWSAYSNLLLYGQTLDIKAAKEAGVMLSLGSDWLPTGSRGILEEVKLAAAYVDKDKNAEGLKKIFTDLELYKMLNENPAKMINHWEIDVEHKEHGIGRLAIGAMGTLLAVSAKHVNPYTNLVRKAFAEDINLVVIDGKPIYGNEKNIQQAKINTYELMPAYFSELNSIATSDTFKVLPEAGATKATKVAHLEYLAKKVASMKLTATDKCGFKEKKAFVHQDSFLENKSAGLANFQIATGINLDRFADVHKLLAVAMLSQSRNRNESSKGKRDFMVKEFSSLYSCNTQKYIDRLFSFIVPGSSSDEFETNQSNINQVRQKQNHGRIPEKMATDYSI
jgi:cytosine/adenosine deaminase-related metal-dependent hydrolase